MIPRYSSPQVDALFSEEAKMSRWLEIELAVAEEMAAEGIVPAADAAACRKNAPVVDRAFVGRVEEREAVTNHDVAAFVDTVQAAIGAPAGAWVHYGLTSTDVVDTGLCWALRDSADLIIAAQTELLHVLVTTARSHAGTVMIGRTHGIHAEPTTFGAKVALWRCRWTVTGRACRPRAPQLPCASCPVPSARTRTSRRPWSSVSPRVSAWRRCRPRR
jgi:adenylosuccinate lyase